MGAHERLFDQPQVDGVVLHLQRVGRQTEVYQVARRRRLTITLEVVRSPCMIPERWRRPDRPPELPGDRVAAHHVRSTAEDDFEPGALDMLHHYERSWGET